MIHTKKPFPTLKIRQNSVIMNANIFRCHHIFVYILVLKTSFFVLNTSFEIFTRCTTTNHSNKTSLYLPDKSLLGQLNHRNSQIYIISSYSRSLISKRSCYCLDNRPRKLTLANGRCAEDVLKILNTSGFQPVYMVM